MIIEADAKALEWRIEAHLSKCDVAIGEILNGVDQHALNQNFFNLPSRLIAKIFLFRWIFGGSAWAYANDPDFSGVSGDPDFWQKVIDRGYEKYPGIWEFHERLVRDAMKTGRYEGQTGAIYLHSPTIRGGEVKWPRNEILNYPVQGLSADIMSVARVSLYRRLKALDLPHVKLINTVHDSIVLDVANDCQLCYNICKLVNDVFNDIPANVKKVFGVELLVPIPCEIKYGPDSYEDHMTLWAA